MALWRTHSFELGLEYEPRETFLCGGGEFIVGKRYALRHVGYSPYDGSTVFRFQALGDEPIDWWWSDDEPDSLFAERFQQVTRVGR